MTNDSPKEVRIFWQDWQATQARLNDLFYVQYLHKVRTRRLKPNSFEVTISTTRVHV